MTTAIRLCNWDYQWEKNPDNAKKETVLTGTANAMMHDHALMEYTQYRYPSTAKNIATLSNIHMENLKTIEKTHDHDIER